MPLFFVSSYEVLQQRIFDDQYSEFIGAHLNLDAASHKMSYSLEIERPATAPTVRSKIPLAVQLLQIPFIQKLLVFCLRAFEITLDDIRVAITHQVCARFAFSFICLILTIDIFHLEP